jgi:hypothetical protein
MLHSAAPAPVMRWLYAINDVSFPTMPISGFVVAVHPTTVLSGHASREREDDPKARHHFHLVFDRNAHATKEYLSVLATLTKCSQPILLDFIECTIHRRPVQS